MFKVYTRDGKTETAARLSDLRKIVGANSDDIRRAYYQNVTTINGHRVLNYRDKEAK